MLSEDGISFPMIEIAEEKDVSFPMIDLIFAAQLLDGFVLKTPAMMHFLAFLLYATRQGFLYVQVTEFEIIPSPLSFFSFTKEFEKVVIEGALTLPQEILGKVDITKPIICEESRFYLQRYYVAYKKCLTIWSEFNIASSEEALDHQVLKNILIEIKQKNILTAKQQEAVFKGCLANFFILTGGPGTGKTFTAASLLETLWQCIDSNIKQNYSIAVVAPTGKAALHLVNSLKNAIIDPTLKKCLNPQTLHSLVRVKNSHNGNREYLIHDLMIVDEASMIDVELMAQFLSLVKPESRLILIGDPYQLPPVEGPGIFTFFLSLDSPQVELDICLRAESKDLIAFANAVRTTASDYSIQSPHILLLDKQLNFHEIVEEFSDRFLNRSFSFDAIDSMMDHLKRFCILTPHRKGAFGTEQFNQRIVDLLIKKGVYVFPIIITENDHYLKLYNGEMGLLVSHQKKFPFQLNQNDVVYFSDQRTVPALLMKSFDLAYAITIHKSQGSEFDEVLVVLPTSQKKYTKELLYTAVTRAKKKLILYNFIK